VKLPNRLTWHAQFRLRTRTSLQDADVLALLENQQTVSVGYWWTLSLWHRLFYSAPDRAHFVAIQDLREGYILTILPLAFYRNQNLACPVDELQLRKAIWLAAPAIHDELYAPAPAAGVKMLYWASALGRNRINLGVHRFSPAPQTAADVLADAAFVRNLRKTLAREGVNPAYLIAIHLFAKRTGHWVKIEWPELGTIGPEFVWHEPEQEAAVA